MSKKGAETMPSRPVKHGIYSFLKSGKINPSIRGCKRLQGYLREIEGDLTADLGGPENLTAAQEVLVKSTVQAYGVLLLAGAYTQKYSILEPVKARRGILELQPVLGHQYIAFLNCVRQNLIALGLDRRKADEALDLRRYAAEKYGVSGADDNGKGKASESREIALPARSCDDGQGKGGEP
jgi:hypothetical protein